MTLLSDRVLILPDEKETKSAGGIILAPNAQTDKRQGTILLVGLDCDTTGAYGESPNILQPGMKVLYGEYSGTEHEYEGKKCLIMREPDIFAIL